jgi:hypothetical protein
VATWNVGNEVPPPVLHPWVPSGGMGASIVVACGQEATYDADQKYTRETVIGRLKSPWAIKSLSDNPHSNVLKDTYDYSCFLARSTKYQHLMTEWPMARLKGTIARATGRLRRGPSAILPLQSPL